MPCFRAARVVCGSNGGCFSHFALLLRRQDSPAHIVVITRAPRIHHQRARQSKRVAQREMNLIGSPRNLADAPHGRVQHHHVALGDAERTKVAGELLSRPHQRS